MKIKVLVVDDNVAFISLLEKYFNGSEIDIVSSKQNGSEAIKYIESNNDFDIILLDLMMPIKDGLHVLKYLKDKKINKDVIVMTSFNGEDVMKDLNEYNVKYVALKPFDIEDMKNIIIRIHNRNKAKFKITEFSDKSIQLKVSKLLHNLGIPSNMKGYQYIRSAILMVYDNPSFIGGITKALYPDISQKYNTSAQRVERAMRHAIEISWLRGDIDLMEDIFGHSVDIDKAKPTNSEFIVTLADKLRLDMI